MLSEYSTTEDLKRIYIKLFKLENEYPISWHNEKLNSRQPKITISCLKREKNQTEKLT
jgi:hypothetical protein